MAIGPVTTFRFSMPTLSIDSPAASRSYTLSSVSTRIVVPPAISTAGGMPGSNRVARYSLPIEEGTSLRFERRWRLTRGSGRVADDFGAAIGGPMLLQIIAPQRSRRPTSQRLHPLACDPSSREPVDHSVCSRGRERDGIPLLAVCERLHDDSQRAVPAQFGSHGLQRLRGSRRQNRPKRLEANLCAAKRDRGLRKHSPAHHLGDARRRAVQAWCRSVRKGRSTEIQNGVEIILNDPAAGKAPTNLFHIRAPQPCGSDRCRRWNRPRLQPRRDGGLHRPYIQH